MSCVFKGTGNGRCGGRIQRHHVVKEQRLRRAFPHGAWRFVGGAVWRPVSRYGPDYDAGLERLRRRIETRSLREILNDPRDLMDVCKDHHERVTGARLRTGIPAETWEFVDEHGMRGEIENDIARAA